MRTLSLLRHAKSSWDSPHLCDFERPLNGRGKKAVPLISAFMTSQSISPDLILCSAAKRTRQTLKLLRQNTKFNCEIQFLDELYLCPEHTVTRLIQNIPERYQHILIVAHNPTLQNLAIDLIQNASAKDIASLTEKYPTAGLAIFTMKLSSWADLQMHSGTLQHFVTPRQLAACQEAQAA